MNGKGYGENILAISNNLVENSESNSPITNNTKVSNYNLSNFPPNPPQLQNFANSDGNSTFSATMYQQHL